MHVVDAEREVSGHPVLKSTAERDAVGDVRFGPADCQERGGGRNVQSNVVVHTRDGITQRPIHEEPIPGVATTAEPRGEPVHLRTAMNPDRSSGSGRQASTVASGAIDVGAT